MYLSYAGITSKHAIFTMSYWGGDYEYSPPVILAGLQVRPEAIQAPLLLPGNTSIGEYTTPPEGLVLDYCQYKPMIPSPDSIVDLYDAAEWESLLDMILCLEVECLYLLPDEEPEIQPSYPASWTDPYNYTHYFPGDFGANATAGQRWIMAYEYGEGAVIWLPAASLCLELPNVLPEGWVDGRYLCLEGGGYSPVYPQMCFPPDSFAGNTEFCISTLSNWDGNWAHGYGGNYYEHWQLTSLEDTTVDVDGWSLHIAQHETVAGFPFFGGATLCNEWVSMDFAGYPSFTPDLPRIIPAPPIDITPASLSPVVALATLISLCGVKLPWID